MVKSVELRSACIGDFTDGILEAANTEQEEFGSDRIAALLTQMPGKDLASIRDSIVSAAQVFGKQADDQTIRRAE